MAPRRLWLMLALTGALSHAQPPAPSVQVTGAVERALALTEDDLMKMPRATVRLEGGGGTYEGVWLHEILKKAGASMGERLRGKILTTYVLAEARDGYQVVFSLAELDPTFTAGQVLLADKLNGEPLEAEQGPFRLVVGSDKPGARSIRMLARLEVVQLKK